MSAREPGSGAVVPVQLQELDCLSSVRIYIPKDLRPPDARQMALKVCHHSAAHIHTLCCSRAPLLGGKLCVAFHPTG